MSARYDIPTADPAPEGYAGQSSSALKCALAVARSDERGLLRDLSAHAGYPKLTQVLRKELEACRARQRAIEAAIRRRYQG